MDYKSFKEEIATSLTVLINSNSELRIAGDFNINLLKFNDKDIFAEFFDTLSTVSVHNIFKYKYNFFCKLFAATFNSTSGILLKNFSDQQPYVVSVSSVSYNKPLQRYIKTTKPAPGAYDNFLSDLRTQNLPSKLNKNQIANPSDNVDILCNTFEKLKSRHFHVHWKKSKNINTRGQN